MGNAHFSVMWRGKELSDEQRNCIMGQAGEKRTSQSRSKIYRQNQHYPHETLLWSCENSKYGSVEIQNMALCAPCASGALLKSFWDPELNSRRVSLDSASHMFMPQ